MAQAVRRSPPTAGVPSSRLGHSMWVSCERNGVWVGFSRGFSRFPLRHSSHPFRFISSALVMVRQAWSAGTLATQGPIIWGFIASHPSTRPCVGHELRIFKSRLLRWAGHVALMEQSRNVYRILVGKPEGKRSLGRPRRKWENNIEMD